jgi:signal transduction histidine kinase
MPELEPEVAIGWDTRRLKHELRTPINHIVGYCDIVLETARELGNVTIEEQATQLGWIGNQLSRVVDANLTSGATRVTNADLLGLRKALAPFVDSIIHLSTAEPDMDISSILRMDLLRIHTAAERLRRLTSGAEAKQNTLDFA